MSKIPPGLRARFDVHRLLGEGSYGAVYLCTRRPDGGRVAIKVLSTATPGTMARFRQEAQIMAGLDHPSICKVLAWGSDANQPWLAMEYLQGETLRARLQREGRFVSGQAVLKLLAQAAEALEHAHGRGVLHRDVKPENLFLTERGLKLLDFGMAKITHGSDSSVRTRAGLILGTPAYMPPERIQGERATPASDVYSLAIVAYEMLSGAVPFRGEPIEVMRGHLGVQPPHLPEYMPPELDEALQRGLIKDPAQRLATPSELVRALGKAAKAAVTRLRAEAEGPAPVELEADPGPAAPGASPSATPRASPRAPYVPEEVRADARTPPATRSLAEVSRQAAAPSGGEGVETRPPGRPHADEADPPPLDPDAAVPLHRMPSQEVRLPAPTRPIRRPSRAVLLSEAIQRWTLLSPEVRPYLLAALGSLLVLALGVRALTGGAPALVYRDLRPVGGVDGVEVRWTTETPQRCAVLVLPQDETPPQSLPLGDELAATDHRRSIGGLRPATRYSIWLAGEDGRPLFAGGVATAASLVVEQVELIGQDPLRLKVTASPPWRGQLGRGEPLGELRRTSILTLPRGHGAMPELMVWTAGAEQPVRDRTYLRPLLDECIRQVEQVDVGRLSFELFRAAGVKDLTSNEAGPEAGRRGREALELLLEDPDVARLWALLPVSQALLGDRSLRLASRLLLARSMARLATLDATLATLGVARPELAAPLEHLVQEVEVEGPSYRQGVLPPPAHFAAAWLPLEHNNLWYQGRGPAVGVDEEDERRRAHSHVKLNFIDERPPRNFWVADLNVAGVEGAGGAQVGVVARAMHPETVLYLEVNGRLVLPVRWRPEHGARRYSIGKLTEYAKLDWNKEAPLKTRLFDLPQDVVHQGSNDVKLWVENFLPEPDAWVPTVHGVFLSGGS